MKVTVFAEFFTRRFCINSVGILTLTEKVMVAFKPAPVASMALGAISTIFPLQSGLSQTLDDAVKEQLAGGGGNNCVVLLGGDNPFDKLTGTLQQICTLGAPSVPPPSSATGGGAAAPATLPGILQRRLREVRSEETKENKVTVASADAAVERHQRRGFFISAEDGASDMGMTPFAAAYDSDIKRLTVGADFQVAPRWVAGLAFDYYRQEGDIKKGGDFVNESRGIVGFGSYLPTDKAFVQFYAEFARKDNERKRFASWEEDGPLVTGGFIDGDYKGDEYLAGILVGHHFLLNNVTISPRAGFDWSHTEFDSYSETGIQTQGELATVPIQGSTGLELRFDKNQVTSLQSRVGVRAQVTIPADAVAIVPHASVDWKHEAEDDRRDVKVSFVEDLRHKKFTYEIESPNRLDRNWAEWDIGMIVAFRNGLRLFGNYRTLTGHDFFESDIITVGLRTPF